MRRPSNIAVVSRRWNCPNLPAFVQARPAAMVAIHSDAELEALKALLIAGHSQSEIGVWLGMRRPVLQGLVQRLKRQGVAVPRSRSGPKPVTIMPPKPVPTVAFEPLAATAAPLLDLADNACRWPVAGEGRATLFCGADRDGHASYCRQHAARSVAVEAPGVFVRARSMARATECKGYS
jgi:hypothetical protein